MFGNDRALSACLRDSSHRPVPLLGSRADVEIDDLLASVTLHQTYKNEQSEAVEAIYTFPLPFAAVLTSMKAVISGKTIEGKAFAKEEAETRYDAAVSDGNGAILLERTGDGLCTATIGNLLPGETAEFFVRYCTAHRWNGSELRFVLPTVIGQRYGDAVKAGIPEQNVPVTDVAFRHPFGISVLLTGQMIAAEVFCPSHALSERQEEGGRRFWADAAADRDFILTLRTSNTDGIRAMSIADGDGFVASVSYTPARLALGEAHARFIDILLDCSGSMAGTSIAQCRVAIDQILDKLTPEDSFNITKFGSAHLSLFPQMTTATDLAMAIARRFVDCLDADMGGTRLHPALQALYRANHEFSQHDILLITDGDIWADDEFYREASDSGARIFPVGVGCAPAEGNLRRLADVTKGKLEMCTPGEGMAQRIIRLFERMDVPLSMVTPSWPGKPLWISPDTPQPCYPGDTLYFFAGYAGRPEGPVQIDAQEKVVRTDFESVAVMDRSYQDLPRLAAAERLKELPDDSALASRIAEQYQLLSRWTSFVLVAEGAAGEKTDGCPKQIIVPQMHAAGWGKLLSPRVQSRVFRQQRSFRHVAQSRLASESFADRVCRDFCKTKSELADPGTRQDYFGIHVSALEKQLEEFIGKATAAVWLCHTLDELASLGLETRFIALLQRIIGRTGCNEREIIGLFLEELAIRNILTVPVPGRIPCSQVSSSVRANLRKRIRIALSRI